MFKFFTEVAEEGNKSIAINTTKVFCAFDGNEANRTTLKLENGAWLTIEGSLLDIVTQLNS